MVHAIKMGWMKPRPAKKAEAEDESKRKFYMLWQTDDQVKQVLSKFKSSRKSSDTGGRGNEKGSRPNSCSKDVLARP